MEDKSKLLLYRNLSLIFITAIIITGLLLVLNFVLFKTHKPLDTNAYKLLIERLRTEPKNQELIDDIRNLDLLARKAYFTAQWQLKTGGILLLVFATGMIIFARLYYKTRELIVETKPEITAKSESKAMHEKWLMGLAILMVFSGLLTAYLANWNYNINYPLGEPISQNNPEDADIQVVSVTDSIVVDINQQTIDTTKLDSTKPNEIKIETNKPMSVKFDDLKLQWNSFRGPFGQGLAYVKDAPTSWDIASGKNILWKTPIDLQGYNSPIVWDNKLFLSGANQTERKVYCFSLENGKLLWQVLVENIPGSPTVQPKTTDDTGLAAPTLTCDAQNVYAIFGNGDLIALNHNGNVMWSKNLGVPQNHYGHSSSLLVYADLLLIQYDSNSGGRALALNSATGEPVWDIRRNNKISWASPVLANVNGQVQLILVSMPTIAGYDVTSGKELWSSNQMSGEVGPSVSYYNGYIIATNEYAKTVAINTKSNNSVAWETQDYMAEVSSPVASNGLVFIATSYGVLACLDAETGSLYWEHDFGEGFYSSGIIVNNLLYLFDKSGNCHMIKVAQNFEEVGKFSVGEAVVTTPAFVNGKMIVRLKNSLIAIGK